MTHNNTDEEDPFAVFADEGTTSLQQAAPPQQQTYDSPYGAAFVSQHHNSLVEFIQEPMIHTCKDLVQYCKQPVLSALLRKSHHSFKRKDWLSCEKDASQIEQICWSSLKEHGGWNHVAWRESYIFSQLMLIEIEVLKNDTNCTVPTAQEQIRPFLQSAIRRVDMAIILGGPLDKLSTFASYIEDYLNLEQLNKIESPKDAQFLQMIFPDIQAIEKLKHISEDHQIKIEKEGLSLEQFTNNYYKRQLPVIIRGEMNNWNAMSKWKDLNYFISNFGHRTVPIELGKHNQKDGDWKEESMTMKDFITRFIIPSNVACQEGINLRNDQIAYLAQHALFDQLHQLQKDIEVPRYTQLGELTNVNAWFGTASTTTPLHFDSYDNCLTQVFGYKYIRLYHPNQTPNLYVSDGGGKDATLMQGNISQVNVEDYDHDQFPMFEKAQYTETILGPGDILFLPANTWHYVRSCTPSFSVSFWFESRILE